MSSTRDFKAPGVFAEDASTTIPPTPIAGVSYRDTTNGTDDTKNGWRYGTRVESQDWNQIMYLMTSMLSMIDTQGVLGWASGVDYTGPALVFGSDDQLYVKTALPSGPNNGGAKDPISNPTYWQSFAARFGGSPGDIKMVAYTTPPSGWLKCNGAAVSRTTYADLFAVIGTTFGAGNGTTTFNLPESRGEFLRGWDDGRGVDPSRAFGSFQGDAIRNITGFMDWAGGYLDNSSGVFSPSGTSGGLTTTTPNGRADNFTFDASAVVPTAAENRPRNLAVMFVIKT